MKPCFKKKLSILVKISVLLVLSLILQSADCVGCIPPGGFEEPPREGDYHEIVTKMWETGSDNYNQFYTNDMRLSSRWGTSYWYPVDCSSDTGQEYTAEVNKVSGRAAYGQGVIFCIQDTPDAGGDLVAKNFYALLINTQGLYQVIKVVDRQQYCLKIEGADKNGWIKAVDPAGAFYIDRGMNKINTIKIETKDTNTNDIPEFSIYINNNLVYEFEESYTKTEDGLTTFDLFKYSLGQKKYGFIVTLSPAEDFPYIPVDVRFKMITPAIGAVQNRSALYSEYGSSISGNGADSALFFENSTLNVIKE